MDNRSYYEQLRKDILDIAEWLDGDIPLNLNNTNSQKRIDWIKASLKDWISECQSEDGEYKQHLKEDINE